MKRIIAAIDNSAAARPVLVMAQAVAGALAGTRAAVHVLELNLDLDGLRAAPAGAR